MTETDLHALPVTGHYFEAPRWHQDRWWVSDVYGHAVLALTEAGDCEHIMAVPAQPSGLGWLPDGSLLVVSMLDQRILRRFDDGQIVEHADLSSIVRGELNDMIVDSRGLAWAGAVGFNLLAGEPPAPSVLVRVDMQGHAQVAADGLLFPNGAVLTGDEQTLIVGETFAAKYTAFTLAADGTLTNRREWASLAAPFGPDGCAIDADGAIWSADALGHRCVRIAEGGQILGVVDAPEGLTIFAVALGGADGHTLLMCAAPDFDPSARGSEKAALLLTTSVDVPRS